MSQVFYNDLDDFSSEVNIPDIIGKGLAELNMIDAMGRLRVNGGEGGASPQSIRNIISTPLGSRFFLPSFGSKLYQVIYEPNDFILKDLISLYIREAIKAWEPRIELEDVLVDTDSNPKVCYVQISYRIRGRNDLLNYVYSMNREVSEMR